MSSFAGRLGGMLAPFMAELVGHLLTLFCSLCVYLFSRFFCFIVTGTETSIFQKLTPSILHFNAIKGLLQQADFSTIVIMFSRFFVVVLGLCFFFFSVGFCFVLFCCCCCWVFCLFVCCCFLFFLFCWGGGLLFVFVFVFCRQYLAVLVLLTISRTRENLTKD